MLFLPLSFIYDEILLKLFGGAVISPSFFYTLIFAGCAGLFLAGLLEIIRILTKNDKATELITIAIFLLAAVYFDMESVVRDVFPAYFPPDGLLHGASGVASQYGNELTRSVLTGSVRFLFFLAPLAIRKAYAELKKRRAAGGQPSGRPHDERKRMLLTALVPFALVIYLETAAFAAESADGPAFAAQYSFNDAAELFGLIPATLRHLRFGILGNPYSGFQQGRMQASELPEYGSGTAGDGEDPTQAQTAGEDAPLAPEKADNGQVSEAGSSDAAGTAADGSEALQEPETASANEPEPVFEFNVMDIDFSSEALQCDAAELSAWLSSQPPSQKNEYTGIFAGKNLILICAESYCDAFIRPDLTPTLWRLTHNGFYFSDFYQPSWGGSTTTGELSLVAGLDSTMGNDAVSGIAGNNHYFTMGNQLQRLGYFSLAFHNGSHTFYKRNTSHEGLGYDAFFASGQHIDAFCGQSYPTDTQMFEGTMPAYLDHQPFSVYYMTVSGHAPYEKNSYYVRHYYDAVNAVVGDSYYEKTKYYICYQMELESALSSMVAKLEEAGIADDTVIVLVGDHYPYGLGNGKTWHNDRDYIDDLIKADDALYWNEDKNGLIIWSGCLEHEMKDMVREISEPVSSLDILPTVSNLFGVEFDSRLLPGRDVFAPDTEPFVFWNNRSWITKAGKYDSRRKMFYPANAAGPDSDAAAENGADAGESGTATPSDIAPQEKEPAPEIEPIPAKEADQEYLSAVAAMVENKILMCSRIMELDYYGRIFGPDEVHGDPEAVWELIRTEMEERKLREEEQLQETDAAGQPVENAAAPAAETVQSDETVTAG